VYDIQIAPDSACNRCDQNDNTLLWCTHRSIRTNSPRCTPKGQENIVNFFIMNYLKEVRLLDEIARAVSASP
jgi:hypothetical protein